MIFCNIDEKLIGIIKQYAGNRTIIDVGCGEGLLHKMIEEQGVVSIDIMNPEDLPFVIKQDACEWIYNEQHFPVVIRPCHSDRFLPRLYEKLKQEKKVKNFLYISHPKNIEIDLPFEDLNIICDNRWTGSDGEQVYIVTLSEDKLNRYVLIDSFENDRDLRSSIGWYMVPENCLGYPYKFLINSAGGHFPLGAKGGLEQFTILDEIMALSFDDLDWYKTYLYSPNWEEYKSGWLSREGKFYGCMSQNHDTVAYSLLKKEVVELEETGWVRIYNDEDYACQHNLSAEQRNFLSKHGFSCSGRL